jgi:NADH:ubiquinone oxidoreductase subunit F (NADH-binding)
VDIEEAKDIHINYHSGRIFFLLMARAKKNGMTDSMFVDRVKNMNIYECALSVAQGELIEMAAVDLLYEELCEQESKGTRQDRYNNFYG